jgi:hypothetical protein
MLTIVAAPDESGSAARPLSLGQPKSSRSGTAIEDGENG